MAVYQRSVMDDEEDEEVMDHEEILDTPDELLTPEDRTYKKRYGDLRRLTQKRDLEIAELNRRLEDSSRRQMRMPNSDDEQALDQWIAEYPDISKVVGVLAKRMAREEMATLDTKVQRFEEDKQRDAERIAQIELARLHPDFFDEIRTDEKFHQWLATKSKKIQDALYSDDSMTDWQTAADVITLYKAENNIKKVNKTDQRREIVREVPTRQKTNPTTQGEFVFSESQIRAMNPVDYDRYEDQITEAWKAGKVLRDVTGGGLR